MSGRSLPRQVNEVQNPLNILRRCLSYFIHRSIDPTTRVHRVNQRYVAITRFQSGVYHPYTTFVPRETSVVCFFVTKVITINSLEDSLRYTLTVHPLSSLGSSPTPDPTTCSRNQLARLYTRFQNTGTLMSAPGYM